MVATGVRVAAAALLVATASLAGCGSDDSDRGGGDGSGPGGTSSGSAIVAPTRDSLEQFWSKTMSSVAPVIYTPVTKWTPYTDDNLPALGCGPALAQNAGYCPRDDSIEYSTDWLEMLDENYSTSGNVSTVVILSHEFGHHISDLHGRDFNLGVGRELQADCYAGVFLAGVSDASYPLALSDGDVYDSLRTLAAIADNPNFLWSNPKAHGGPEERRAAMARGYISGDPTFCRAYEKTGPILVQQVGAYTLRLPPAATVLALDGGALRVTTTTEPEFTIDLTAVASVSGSDTAAALTSYLPTYFGQSPHSLVGPVEPLCAVAGGT